MHQPLGSFNVLGHESLSQYPRRCRSHYFDSSHDPSKYPSHMINHARALAHTQPRGKWNREILHASLYGCPFDTTTERYANPK